ncbi:MAG: HU family DNA-binding protein [Paludibacteraceae bacterium]|nr:HU family DNA-binding protein [Paludibacteraceae bacterium]
MTTKELISLIAARTGMSRQKVTQLMSATTEVMVDTLQNDTAIQMQNFGTLEVKTRAARAVTNPKTGEKKQTPTKRVISFRPNRQLKTEIR